MILLTGMLLGMVLGLITKGQLDALAHHRLRGIWIFIALLVIQLVATRIPVELPDAILLSVFWMIPALGCLMISLWNVREPGFALVALGLALNIVVIAVNGGMPVLTANAGLIDGQAQEVYTALDQSWLHIPAETGTSLLWLSDVLPVSGLGMTENLVSIGDVYLSLGLGVYIFVAMHDQFDDRKN